MPTQSFTKPYLFEQNMIRRFPRWFIGIPVDFWLTNARIIKDVIKENRLKPVAAESLHHEFMYGMKRFEFEAENEPMMASEDNFRLPFPFPGGIRVPHLHYKGDLFILDEKQWGNFSQKIVEGLQQKLTTANSVNFEQVVILSEAIDAL